MQNISVVMGAIWGREKREREYKGHNHLFFYCSEMTFLLVFSFCQESLVVAIIYSMKDYKDFSRQYLKLHCFPKARK